jgi:hypothetical protein
VTELATPILAIEQRIEASMRASANDSTGTRWRRS